MNKHQALGGHEPFDAKTSEALVAMLDQTLADTLDLADQTKLAHGRVKGTNVDDLHLLFDSLQGQLSTYGNHFAERAVTLRGSGGGILHAASFISMLETYPLDAKRGMVHVNALVDRYSDYTDRIRKGIRKAGKLGDSDSADLYASVSRAMGQALWMLTSHHDV